MIKSGLLVLLALIVSRIFSFLVEIIVAAKLGIGIQSDAYSMVAAIQQMLYPVLSVGIFQIFLPQYKKISLEKAKINLNSFTTIALIFFSALATLVSLLVYNFASEIVSFVVPAFNFEQKRMTETLVKYTSPVYLFITIAALLSSILIAKGRVFISQIREAITHVPMIIAMLYFYDNYGFTSIVYGLLFGAFFRMGVLVPFAIRIQDITLNMSEWKEFFIVFYRKWLPSILSALSGQLNTFVDRFMVSGLSVGSVSYLSYGSRIFNVIHDLLYTVLSTTTYPRLIELQAKNDELKLSQLINDSIRLLLLIGLPITIGAILYSYEIVDLLFVRGAFTVNDASITAQVFSAYMLAVPLVPFIVFFDNLHYGLGDTRTPFFFNFLNLILNIILNIILIGSFGVLGIALATSISTIFLTIFRIKVMSKKVKLKLKELFLDVLTFLLVSIVSILPVRLITDFYSNYLCSLEVLLIAVPSSLFIYLIVFYFKREPFLLLILNRINEKLGIKS